jgi:hypothetical protein
MDGDELVGALRSLAVPTSAACLLMIALLGRLALYFTGEEF